MRERHICKTNRNIKKPKRFIFLKDIYIHKNIKHLRKSRGLDQNDVGEAIGINYTMIGKYESGKRRPVFEKLIALQQFFDVNLHDLVFTDLEKYPQGAPPEKPDPRLERTVLRLNRELDELSQELIARADPEDLVRLRAYRAELIQRYPEAARDLGIRE